VGGVANGGSGATGAASTGGQSATGGAAGAPAGLLFFDDFEYDVGREEANAPQIFQTEGGWSWAKTYQAGEPGARGYMYTSNRIPGFSGSFPGTGSTRVLAMEALPTSLAGQTDFYLQYGDENASADTIPADVWFQFWIYPNHYDDPADVEDQRSVFSRSNKFLYPCKSFYPCTTNTWLVSMGSASKEPHNQELGPSAVDQFLVNGDPEDTDFQCASEYPTNAWKLGQTDVSERVVANRWTLVKLHIDTSGTGTWEGWLRPAGGAWVKVIEWIDGTTPCFNWDVPDSTGHRVLRMPTTVNEGEDPGVAYDYWMYMDDFAMATAESALPVYP
jgi:hypothetical protein